MPDAKPQSAPRDLIRVLDGGHATAIVIGTIIGSGIFLVPHKMMAAAGSATMVNLVWVVGGVLSLFGALTYAELGAMKPQAGGEYVYIRDAYGPLPAFLYMWTWFIVSKPASVGSICIGLMMTLANIPALSILGRAAVHHPLEISYAQLGAIAVAWIMTGLNYIGVKRAADFQLAFTILKVLMILAIVAIGFSYIDGSMLNFGIPYVHAKGGIAGFMAALIAALWAYDGWNDLSMVAGEVKNPERNLPKALVLGVLAVGILYLLTNAAVQYVLPAATLGEVKTPVAFAVGRVLGGGGGIIIACGIALSLIVSVNGTIMSGARVPFAAARDGYFFNSLATVSPRFRTPSASLLVQGLLSTALILLVSAFEDLFDLAIYSEWLFYMIAASTIFVFRNREPKAYRPYRLAGYPAIPALFVAAAAVLLYYSFVENLRNSAICTLVILAGIPLFYAINARRQRTHIS